MINHHQRALNILLTVSRTAFTKRQKEDTCEIVFHPLLDKGQSQDGESISYST